VSRKRGTRRRRKRLDESLTICIKRGLNRSGNGPLRPLDPHWWTCSSEFPINDFRQFGAHVVIQSVRSGPQVREQATLLAGQEIVDCPSAVNSAW
jgi:hypothetical protein